jgi:N-formylglutamate amidohydrolase
MRQSKWQEKWHKRANTATRQRLQVRLDKIAIASFHRTYKLSQPKTLTTPLVLSSPHSGRHYPPSFLAQTQLTKQQLRQSEDCFVDQIIAPLTDFGIPMIAAKCPRIFLDLNRGPDEWPPVALAMRQGGPWPITTRARAGLGVVPIRTGPDTDIYPHEVTEAMVRGRLNAFYRPYHQALQNLLQKAEQQFGNALLLDCHSMPGHDAAGQTRPDIVLGNCYGDSCHPETIDFIEAAFASLGYTVLCNNPYAGGYITSHYGQTTNNVEAVQIELNKDLYLNPDTLQPHIGMAELSANIQTVILAIKDHLNVSALIAAE